MKPKPFLVHRHAKHLLAFAVSVVALMVGALPLSAATITWNVNANGNWQTAANWNPASVPGSGDIANFVGNGSATVFDIDFSGATGSGTNNGANNQIVGQIQLSGTAQRTIGAGTATNGTLTLQGVAGVVLASSSGFNLTLSPNVNAATGVMGVALASSGAVNITNTGSITVNSVISDGGNNFGITKTGAGSGQFVLAAANTFTGGLTINGGTVNLNFAGTTAPVSNIVAATNALAFNGSSTLLLTGKASTSNSQTFASTALNSGAVALTLSANATANPLSVNLGALARSAGATLNITQPTGTVSATNGVVFSGGTGVTAPAASTILTATNGAAFATVGGTDWAAKDATNSFVVGLSTVGGYTNFTTGNVVLTGNADLTGAAGTFTLTGASTPTTLRNTAIAGNTLALNGNTLSTGGILSNQDFTISGAGSLRAATAGGELVLNQSGNTTTVSSTIEDNTSASSLTKTGAGALTLSGANTYSGGTNIGAGFVRVANNDTALGSGAVTFHGNATLASASGGGARNLANSVVINSGMTASIDSGFASLTLSGVISGAGSLATASTGTTILTANNTFTGTTTVGSGSILQVGNGGSTGTMGAGAVTLNGTGSLTINRTGAYTLPNVTAAATGGTFTVSGGANVTSSTTFTTMSQNLTINSGSTLTMRGGAFGGNRLQGAGVITINSGGALVLVAGNAHSLGGDNAGMTESVVINGGMLTINQEQYLNSVTFNGATVNGSSEMRASNATNWQVTGTTASTISANVSHVGAANWDVSDVTSSSAADMTISGNVIGAGVLNKAGVGTLALTSNSNTYSGTTTITAGTLLANNASGSATGTSAVSVAAAGTLGGTGRIAPTVANGISVSGVLAPGAGIGTFTVNLSGTTGILTMQSGSSFSFELGAAGGDINTVGTSDLLNIASASAGDVAFNGNVINLTGGGVGFYKLIDTDSNNASTWTGLVVAGDGTITSGLSTNLGANGILIMGGSSLGGTAGDIYLQVVPEPSVAMLGGLGLLGLLRRRRN